MYDSNPAAASILIKPASSNCNINCDYCFYRTLSSERERYSMGFMSESTLERLIINAFEYAGKHITFAFQGGEPTLCGIDFFKKAIELENKYNTREISVENTIQTNGILIDENWCEFIRDNGILIGLSLDGYRELHDKYRKDEKGHPTYDRIKKTIQLFNEFKVDYNILSVITDNTCEHTKELYDYYRDQHFQYIQIIPCIDERNRSSRTETSDAGTEDKPCHDSEFDLDPEKYGAFLCELFDMWIRDFERGYIEQNGLRYQVPDIRFFSNLAQMAAGYPPEECGLCGHCTCYFVVEGNGDVYPCDFYCTDEWKLGTLEKSFADLKNSEKAKDFVKASYVINEECKACEYYGLCRGGCRRWREDVSDSLVKNKLCEGYKMFFKHATPDIYKLSKIILNTYGPYCP